MARAVVTTVALLLLAALAPGAVGMEQASLRVHENQGIAQRDVVKMQPPTQNVRVCNAYADGKPLNVFRGHDQLNSYPIDYKECQSFDLDLHDDEELNFNTGTATSRYMGSFSATDMPTHSSSLLLVAQRRDEKTNFISFQSHIFADTETPQIAVIDAYGGPTKQGVIEMADQEQVQKDADELLQKNEKKASAMNSDERRHAIFAQVVARNSRQLEYNTVLSLSDGTYNFALVDGKGKRKSESMLQVNGKGTYVAMRVGTGKGRFDQDLVVMGAAGALRLHVAALAIVLLGTLGVIGA